MRLLITGAGGFVGRRLSRVILRRFPNAALDLWDNGDADPASRVVDIADAAAVERAVRDFSPSHVVHLAGLASVGQARDAAAENWRINFGGTFNLATALSRTSPDCRFVFASSAEVYGESFRDGMVSETTPLRPRNAYSRAKAAAEAMLADVMPNARITVLRLFNHSGAGQDRRFVVPDFAAQIAAIEADRAPPVIATGNLDVERDFMHVEDAVEAYLAALAWHADGPGCAVFNVGSSRPVTIRSVLHTLIEISAARPEVVTDPSRVRPNEIKRMSGSTLAFRSRYGWQTTHDIRDMLGEVLAAERARLETLRE